MYIHKISMIDGEGNRQTQKLERLRGRESLPEAWWPSFSIQDCSLVFTLSTLSAMVCSLSVRVPTLSELVSLGTPI